MAATDTGPFALVPEWVLYSAISDRALRLYGALAAHADRASGEAWPSRRRLADLLTCSMDSIDRAKQELLDLGALAAESRCGPDGAQRSNLYRVIRLHPSGPPSAPLPRGSREAAAGEGREAAAQNKSQSEPESVNEIASLPLGLPAKEEPPRDPVKVAAEKVTRRWWDATTPKPTPAGGFPAIVGIIEPLLRAGWEAEEIGGCLPRCGGWVTKGAMERELRSMRARSGGAANPGDLT